MERMTTHWMNGSFDTFEPIDIMDNEYSKVNYEKLLTKLGQYEDAEENGLLLRLPCKLKTTVYWICGGKIRDVVVFGFKTLGSRIFMLDYGGYDFGIMGVDTFLTVEEAEQALAEMQKG